MLQASEEDADVAGAGELLVDEVNDFLCCWCFSSFKTGQRSFLQFACLCWGEAARDRSLGSSGGTEVCVGSGWLQRIPGGPMSCVDFYQQLPRGTYPVLCV